jgi:hypothetical protein
LFLLSPTHPRINRDDLPSSLLSSLQVGLSHPTPSYARIVLHRTLLYLHESVKSLSSNRLPKGRLLMFKVAETLFPTVRELHERMLSGAVDKLRKDGFAGGEEVEDIELALVAFKTLSKLLVYGFQHPDQQDMSKVRPCDGF